MVQKTGKSKLAKKKKHKLAEAKAYTNKIISSFIK